MYATEYSLPNFLVSFYLIFPACLKWAIILHNGQATMTLYLSWEPREGKVLDHWVQILKQRMNMNLSSIKLFMSSICHSNMTLKYTITIFTLFCPSSFFFYSLRLYFHYFSHPSPPSKTFQLNAPFLLIVDFIYECVCVFLDTKVHPDHSL